MLKIKITIHRAKIFRFLNFSLSFCSLTFAFCSLPAWSLVFAPNRPDKTKKVAQNTVACFGEYRLRMELNALDYIIPVSHPHYYPLRGPGSYFETGWKPFSFDNQRMVTRRRKRVGYALIDSFAIVMDSRGLAMDRHCPTNFAAVHMADTLMPQTHPQYRDFATEMPYCLIGDACLERCTGPWRDYDMAGGQLLDFN